MPDHDRRAVELARDVLEVVGDLAHGLPREDLGVLLRFTDRLGVVGPAGHQCGVAGLLEHFRPVVPTARQQPQAVDEHHRRLAGCIGAIDLGALVLVDARHDPSSGSETGTPIQQVPARYVHARA
jgi:hypothetical protein